MMDILLDTCVDSIKLIPFLFLTYMVLEYLEHLTGDRTAGMIQKAGNFGPLVGAILGVVPQCGFSAVASNFYAGRVITLGTLVAVYLSTSDEILPILLSESVEIAFILKVLGVKLLVGMVAGYLIDFGMKRSIGKVDAQNYLNDMCEREHCQCEHGIIKSAMKHTIQIISFVFLLSLGMNLLIAIIGEESLSRIILNRPIIGPMLASLVGLIPNCASSVILTQVYLKGAMTIGAMVSGLLVNAGVGYLVLFRMNQNIKENMKIVVGMYMIGSVTGILLDMIGFM